MLQSKLQQLERNWVDLRGRVGKGKREGGKVVVVLGTQTLLWGEKPSFQPVSKL